MNKTSRVFVLAEDEPHQRFIYRFLKELRFASHEIRVKVAPAGRGSAEQWVREHYAEEVKEFRSRAAQTALVVAIDADNREVHIRQRQLEQTLAQVGLDRRTDEERIAHLIPKRNIETWILCLNGVEVDEDSNYKDRHDVDVLIKPAAIAFFEGSRPNIQPPRGWTASLCFAIPEARRLD